MSGAHTDANVAVVTGANRGIERETAKQLAQQRLHVVLAGHDGAACAQAADELGRGIAASASLSSQTLDVGNADSVQAFADWATSEFGRVDVLVNNAGVYLNEDGAALALADDNLRRTLEVNLYGPLRLVGHSYPP